MYGTSIKHALLSKEYILIAAFAFAAYVKERLASILYMIGCPFPHHFWLDRHLEPNKELKMITWYESIQWQNQFLACINSWSNNYIAWTGLTRIDNINIFHHLKCKT